ncbi:AraC family transcriptional regulator [Chitinophaga japonensis]|uniref:AraC-like DNA-binding protein n=1 Tax=Chitinophaga japonensis TaxID=104662 RepID=A0A562SJE1_CHIJA|nr:helix-turn-helix domain-containing protein [Chitinophaga japonensis]TWI80910.1 AraC-like DNA-binding protein [Chitinophaga japonensis]
MHTLNRPTAVIRSGAALQQPATGSVLPFEIRTLEWTLKHRWGQQAAPRRHNHYMIIWIRQGRGALLADLEQYDITGETVYCLAPGQILLFNAAEGVSGYVLSFTTEFLCLQEHNFTLLNNMGLFHACSPLPVIKVSRAMAGEMEEIMEKMTREYDNCCLLRAEILKGFLKIFLIYLARQFEKPGRYSSRSKHGELASRFLALLEKRYASWKMVSDYAEELFVTSNYLNEIVKKVSGFPASYHIRQRIVLEAKRQAMYADASMKEIAYHLGFDDIAHFSKFFKNVSGSSFTAFRKAMMQPC